MAYTKNIAVIKGIKDGFSADGGKLSGLIKAEKYGTKLRIEVSLINFAPLTEGRYVCAISDGKATQIFEDGVYEGESGVDTSQGFASLICLVKGQVYPVASAICGNFHDTALSIKGEVEKAENLKTAMKKPTEEENKQNEKEKVKEVYEDEAIAEVNYYEYAKTDENGRAVCEDKKEETKGSETLRDEEASCAVEEKQNGVKNAETKAYSGGNEEISPQNPIVESGIFYENMKDEIDGILQKYPPVKELEELIEGSKWVKISYGDGVFYVFGVLYSEEKPAYICYGVPAEQSAIPPESMKDMVAFIPCSKDDATNGYWVMYQDAETGASIKVNAV